MWLEQELRVFEFASENKLGDIRKNYLFGIP